LTYSLFNIFPSCHSARVSSISLSFVFAFAFGFAFAFAFASLVPSNGQIDAQGTSIKWVGKECPEVKPCTLMTQGTALIRPHLQGSWGYWLLLIGVSRAVFPFPSSYTSTWDTGIYSLSYLLSIHSSIYLSVSSLPSRATYLLERSLHVFVVCSPCCFYEALYTAPVPLSLDKVTCNLIYLIDDAFLNWWCLNLIFWVYKERFASVLYSLVLIFHIISFTKLSTEFDSITYAHIL